MLKPSLLSAGLPSSWLFVNNHCFHYYGGISAGRPAETRHPDECFCAKTVWPVIRGRGKVIAFKWQQTWSPIALLLAARHGWKHRENLWLSLWATSNKKSSLHLTLWLCKRSLDGLFLDTSWILTLKYIGSISILDTRELRMRALSIQEMRSQGPHVFRQLVWVMTEWLVEL